MCAQEHRDRRLFAESTPPLSEHAHDQAMVDSTTASSQEGEGLQVLDTHLERIHTYERDGSVREPGGASVVHPGSDSETVIDDDAHQLRYNSGPPDSPLTSEVPSPNSPAMG